MSEATQASDGARIAAFQHRAETLAATLPALQVAAEHVADTVAQGIHGRRRVGLGETFWQYRRYEPSDLPNRIDWRRSARGDHVYVRETEWDAAQSIWLWRDGSASMNYRSDNSLPTKRDHADLITMAAMSLLVRGGERIALIGNPAPPTGGRAAFNRLCASLAVDHVTKDHVTKDASDDGLPPEAPLPRHASLVLIGDFLSPLPDIEKHLRAFGDRGVRGHLLQILDPAETSMPFTGRSRFEGLEAEGNLLVGRAESLRTDYLERLTRHQAALADLARLTGWSFAIHHTDRPPEPTLLALYGVMTNQPEL